MFAVFGIAEKRFLEGVSQGRVGRVDTDRRHSPPRSTKPSIVTADTDLRGKIEGEDGKAIIFNAITLG